MLLSLLMEVSQWPDLKLPPSLGFSLSFSNFLDQFWGFPAEYPYHQVRADTGISTPSQAQAFVFQNCLALPYFKCFFPSQSFTQWTLISSIWISNQTWHHRDRLTSSQNCLRSDPFLPVPPSQSTSMYVSLCLSFPLGK